MLTAQDMSYDEARNLHSKWQKHQAFMAELASNKDWLDKIDKVQYDYEGLNIQERKSGKNKSEKVCVPVFYCLTPSPPLGGPSAGDREAGAAACCPTDS